MSVDRLRTLLGDLGLDASPVELAEVIWMALNIPAPPSARAAVGANDPDAARDDADDPAADPPTEPEPGDRVPLHLAASAEVPGSIPGASFRARSATALPGQLELFRALRPLKRRIPSRYERELDEELTARDIASRKIWLPAFVPAKVRRWDLVLVVDADPGMAVWGTVAEELVTLFRRLSAFRDVRVQYLHGSGEISNSTGPVGEGAGRLKHSAGELLDTTGKRMILVLSDCVGAAWREGRAQRILATWARSCPVAILQPLPERVWTHTGITPIRGRLESTAQQLPDSKVRLGFTDYSPNSNRLAPGEIALPVVEIEPRWLGAWARLMSAPGGTSADAVAEVVDTTIGRSFSPPDTTDPAGSAVEIGAQERLVRFRSIAPTNVFQLAGYLSAVPTLNLGIMRLIQRAMLPASSPADLAEIIYSGLLTADPNLVTVQSENLQYDFLPGIRTFAQTGSFPNIVVPALWDPVQPQDMPPWAREIQYAPTSLGSTYRSFGLEELVRVKDHEATYRQAIHYLARRIVDVVTADEQLRPLNEPPQFHSLPDEFAGWPIPLQALSAAGGYRNGCAVGPAWHRNRLGRRSAMIGNELSSPTHAVRLAAGGSLESLWRLSQCSHYPQRFCAPAASRFRRTQPDGE